MSRRGRRNRDLPQVSCHPPARDLGFLVSAVVSMARSRCVRNREHPVTVRAPEETDIVHHPDPSEARGFTEGTPGWWLQEQAEASLVGGLSHL
jgi:hypothetical protein